MDRQSYAAAEGVVDSSRSEGGREAFQLLKQVHRSGIIAAPATATAI